MPHRTKRRLLSTLLFLSTAIFLTWGCSSTEVSTGKAAPDFTLTALDGSQVQLAGLKGNVVVLDFWATWCPPCRASLPHVQKISVDKARFDKGLRLLAVNSGEDKAAVEGFLNDNHYTFTVLMDPKGEASSAYHVAGIPMTVIIGRDGIVRKTFEGYSEGVAAEIDQAVAEAMK